MRKAWGDNGNPSSRPCCAQACCCPGWQPTVPVRLYAGTADRDVVFTNAESCETDLRARGARDVRLVNVGDVDHFASARAVLPEIARDW